MQKDSVDPLDTGRRYRQKRPKRRLPKWVRRLLRNRRVLLIAIWVVKATVYLARLISQVRDGS